MSSFLSFKGVFSPAACRTAGCCTIEFVFLLVSNQYVFKLPKLKPRKIKYNRYFESFEYHA